MRISIPRVAAYGVSRLQLMRLVRTLTICFLLEATLQLVGIPTLAATAAHAGAAATQCAAIKAKVDEVPGGGPVFLASYGAIPGAPDEPALDGAAFTYDNALAVMALSACGHREEARRVGDAILAASAGDRSGAVGRIRNAYRAGAVSEYPPPPMGWWDGSRNAWFEDPYQVGSATGNLAWAGLALLTLHDQTGEVRYRDGAASHSPPPARSSQSRKATMSVLCSVDFQVSGWASASKPWRPPMKPGIPLASESRIVHWAIRAAPSR